MVHRLFTTAVALLSLFSSRSAAQESADASPVNGLHPSDIFGFTNIWTIHLIFTPEQWQAMEPKETGRPRGRRGSFLQGPEGGRNGIAAAFGIVYEYVRADVE